MFKKLLGWFSSGKDDADIYHPKERKIYQYHNGTKLVLGDPMDLYKRMMEKGPELSIDIKVACSPSRASGDAYDKVVDKVRDIFELPHFKEGGLGKEEVVDLLVHFLGYCDRQKKNTPPSATSSTPTGASELLSESPLLSTVLRPLAQPRQNPVPPSLHGRHRCWNRPRPHRRRNGLLPVRDRRRRRSDRDEVDARRV